MSADWDDVRTETIIHAAARLRRFGDLLSTKVVAAKLKVNKDVLYKRKSSGPPAIQSTGRPQYPAVLIMSCRENLCDAVAVLLADGIRDDLIAWLEKAGFSATMVRASQTPLETNPNVS